MRRTTIVRHRPTVQINNDFRVDLVEDALLSAIADLRCRVERTGTRREVSQVVLAGAHIDEAVGVLRTIQAGPSAYELDVRGSTAPRTRRVRRLLLRAGHPHPVRAVSA